MDVLLSQLDTVAHAGGRQLCIGQPKRPWQDVESDTTQMWKCPAVRAGVAYYYLRQHGRRVRVAVLDGSTPVDFPVFQRIAASSWDDDGYVAD